MSKNKTWRAIKAGMWDREYSNDYDDERGPERVPERRLLCAVLMRAILDLLSREAHIRREAVQWFHAPPLEHKLPFSFRWLCNSLDIDSGCIEKELEKEGFFKDRYEDRPHHFKARLNVFIPK